jgi:hypothetical protein
LSAFDAFVKPMMMVIWPDYCAKQFENSQFLGEQHKI